ncbi:hypothetical protein GUJ93_ZPchr0013g34538 [Zizania palustris]|uniref:Uncharacterized protein n=1 Tax=Zizania palustris TaxID=103762 RepID=A0A8J5WU30_ZIZPA|nr:hypothetical protein GUJ93_ZPchr0013g34538 [Zizania palustris]
MTGRCGTTGRWADGEDAAGRRGGAGRRSSELTARASRDDGGGGPAERMQWDDEAAGQQRGRRETMGRWAGGEAKGGDRMLGEIVWCRRE